MKSLPFNARLAGIVSAIFFPFYYFEPFAGFFGSLVKSLIIGVVIAYGYGLISKKRTSAREEFGIQSADSDHEKSIRRALLDKSRDLGERAATAADVLVSAAVSMDSTADAASLTDSMFKLFENEEHPLIARLKMHPDFSVPGSLLSEAIKVFNELQQSFIDLKNRNLAILADTNADFGRKGEIAVNVVLGALASMGKVKEQSPQEKKKIMDLFMKVPSDGYEHELVQSLKDHPDFAKPNTLLHGSIAVLEETQKKLKQRQLDVLFDPNAEFDQKGEVAVNVVLGALVSMGKLKNQSAEEKKSVMDMFMKLPKDGEEHPLIQMLEGHPDFNRPNTRLYGSIRVFEEAQQRLKPTFEQEMLGAAFAFNNVLVEMGREENTDEGRLRTLELMQKKFDKDGGHPLVDIVKAHPSFNQEGSYLSNAMKVFLKVQWALMDE